MTYTKEKVLHLNELLKEVRENKDGIVSIIEQLCPIGIDDCDANVESSPEAKKCEYFVLCNVLCSYSLMSEEERKEWDKNYELLYSTVKKRQSNGSVIYM